VQPLAADLLPADGAAACPVGGHFWCGGCNLLLHQEGTELERLAEDGRCTNTGKFHLEVSMCARLLACCYLRACRTLRKFYNKSV
jgi:hypothetical protein